MIGVAALAPWIGFEVGIPAGGWVGRLTGGEVNAPVSDIVAAVIVVAVLVRSSFVKLRMTKGLRSVFLATGIVFASGLLSAINADDHARSVKFVLYPLLFSIVAYGLAPAFVVRSKLTMEKVLRVVYGTGIVAAVMGFISLFVGSSATNVWRATTLPIFGDWPLGVNHNSLAQTLIVAIPIGFALGRRYAYGSWAMLAIALLTFSRAAWMILAAMGFFMIWHHYRIDRRARWYAILGGLIIATPFALAIGYFSTGPGAAGSVASRIAMTDVAIVMFGEHPWIGAGAGTFRARLDREPRYTNEFGRAVEAHGLVQKTLAEQGIVGLFAITLLLATVVRAAWRSMKNPIGLALFLGATGMIVYELSDASYYTAKLWLPIGLLLAYAFYENRSHPAHA